MINYRLITSAKQSSDGKLGIGLNYIDGKVTTAIINMNKLNVYDTCVKFSLVVKSIIEMSYRKIS